MVRIVHQSRSGPIAVGAPGSAPGTLVRTSAGHVGAPLGRALGQPDPAPVKTTIITVYITVVILVMKVFDIVYVITNGAFKTEVIANLFFKEIFNNRQAGQAAAIVVVLLVAILPIMVY